MIIGDNSYYNKHSLFREYDDNTITIGDNVAIGYFVYMSTRMHKVENHQEYTTGSIIIEDNVWIGNGAVIYPNVTVGTGSVIGANTVITKSIAPNTVVKVLCEEYSKERKQ